MKASEIVKKALDYYYKRLSHKKIVYINNMSVYNEFKQEYEEYMAKYRILNEDYVCDVKNISAFDELLKQDDKPTAVLVYGCDDIEVIFDVIVSNKLRVPEDISVMCICDANKEIEKIANEVKMTFIDSDNNLVRGNTTSANRYYIDSKKEVWDAYYPDGTMAGCDIIRGEEIPEHLRHLVSEVFVKHVDGTILVMQRDLEKLHSAGLWETGASGSVLKGESDKEAAVRELLEETGIATTEDKLNPIYDYISSQSLYSGFEHITDIQKDKITLQKGETIDYKWLTLEEFLEMFSSDKFVASKKKRLAEYVNKMKMS